MANAIIQGFECTLFYDYDCERHQILPKLTDENKIQWLESRMHMIFLDPLIQIFDRESIAHKALNYPPDGAKMTPMLMAVSLLMNGIEALGSFLTTSDNNGERFQAFMDKYMSEWTIEVDAPHHGRRALSDILWSKYRNGLAHSFAILHAGVDDVPGEGKYMVAENVLQIDAWKFFADLRRAIDRMFQDVRQPGDLQKLFLRTFSKVYRCDARNAA
jgi:hypothetical protein